MLSLTHITFHSGDARVSEGAFGVSANSGTVRESLKLDLLDLVPRTSRHHHLFLFYFALYWFNRPTLHSQTCNDSELPERSESK